MQFFSKVILMQFLYSILSWFSSRIHLAAATLLVYLLLKNLLASWISVFLKITFPYQQKPLNSPAYPESNNSRTVERQSLQSAVDSRAPESSLSLVSQTHDRSGTGDRNCALVGNAWGIAACCGYIYYGYPFIQGKSDAWNRDRGSALDALLACERDGVR